MLHINGLYNFVLLAILACHSLFRIYSSRTSSDRVTPVPIPNTEVKPISADGSPLGESRSVRELCILNLMLRQADTPNTYIACKRRIKN